MLKNNAIIVLQSLCSDGEFRIWLNNYTKNNNSKLLSLYHADRKNSN